MLNLRKLRDALAIWQMYNTLTGSSQNDAQYDLALQEGRRSLLVAFSLMEVMERLYSMGLMERLYPSVLRLKSPAQQASEDSVTKLLELFATRAVKPLSREVVEELRVHFRLLFSLTERYNPAAQRIEELGDFLVKIFSMPLHTMSEIAAATDKNELRCLLQQVDKTLNLICPIEEEEIISQLNEEFNLQIEEIFILLESCGFQSENDRYFQSGKFYYFDKLPIEYNPRYRGSYPYRSVREYSRSQFQFLFPVVGGVDPAHEARQESARCAVRELDRELDQLISYVRSFSDEGLTNVEPSRVVHGFMHSIRRLANQTDLVFVALESALRELENIPRDFDFDIFRYNLKAAYCNFSAAVTNLPQNVKGHNLTVMIDFFIALLGRFREAVFLAIDTIFSDQGSKPKEQIEGIFLLKEELQKKYKSTPEIVTNGLFELDKRLRESQLQQLAEKGIQVSQEPLPPNEPCELEKHIAKLGLFSARVDFELLALELRDAIAKYMEIKSKRYDFMVQVHIEHVIEILEKIVRHSTVYPNSEAALESIKSFVLTDLTCFVSCMTQDNLEWSKLGERLKERNEINFNSMCQLCGKLDIEIAQTDEAAFNFSC